jgi:uncharacterized protein (DUF2267 family)
MQNRIVTISMLSAGLMLGSLALPVRAADDQSKDQTTTTEPKSEKPQAGNRAAGFPLLDRLHKAVKELKLSDDVSEKVDKYFDESKSQLKKIREESAGDRKEAMQKSKEVFEKLREKVADLLSEDQKAELKTKLQEVFRQGAGAGGEMMGRLKSALGKLTLSDEQKEKLQKLQEDAEGKIKELHENGGEGAGKKIGTLLQETREKIMGVLTDEQKEKLKELLKPAQQ